MFLSVLPGLTSVRVSVGCSAWRERRSESSGLPGLMFVLTFRENEQRHVKFRLDCRNEWPLLRFSGECV